jgi:uncharacterized protein YfaS (alpha-2-macroglobulin family)
MTRYATPNPLKNFLLFDYDTERLSNIDSFLTENRDPSYAYMNKGYIVGEGKGEIHAQIRGNFPLTPLWIGSLRADANGVVQTRFKAPDNLSEFRVMAVAAHGASSFGSGQTSFKIQKSLQLQPGNPLFARLNDKLRLRAIVQNMGATPLNVQVDLAANRNLTLLTKRQTVSVPPRATVPIEIDATFNQIGKTRLEWRALSLGLPTEITETDGVESFVEVVDSAPVRHQSMVFQVQPGTRDLLQSLPEDLIKPGTEVRLNAFHKPVAQLHPAAEALMHYPYGCAEQTVSSTLPWLLTKKLGLSNAPLELADKRIRSGIDRLATMVCQDEKAGRGIGYWPGASKPMPFATAYAGVLLGTLRQMRPEDFDKLVPHSLRYINDYLANWLRAPADGSLLTDTVGQCMAAYALALLGAPEVGAEERLVAIADILSEEERALLALAILQREGTQTTAKRLLTMEGGRDPESYFWTPTRSLGIRLMAWHKLAPGSDETSRLVAQLLEAQSLGTWGNTQSNAWALLALSEALPQSPISSEIKGAFIIDRHQAAFALSQSNETASASATLQSPAGQTRLSVANDSNEPLYLRVDLTRRENPQEAPKMREGYSIERTFQKIDSQNQPVSGPLHPGDLVRVELKLTAHQSGNYLAIECPLPSLLEPDQAFATRTSAVSARRNSDQFSDYRETHADRFLFFKNSLKKGSYVIRALARVRTTGESTAASAKIEEMYYPERFGRTEIQKLSSESK